MSDNPFADAVQAAKDQAPASAGIRITPVTDAAAPAPVSANPFADAVDAARKAPDATSEKEQGPAPDWQDIPGLAKKNFGTSAANFGSNIWQAASHPIDTAENLGKVGLGYIEKGGKALGLPAPEDSYENYADAVNKMVVDRYGSMDNFKRTLATDPVGAAADLSAVFTEVGGLASKAPGIAGKVGSAVSAVGSAIDPMNVIAKPVMGVAKGVTALAREGLGHGLGVGPEAVSAASEAGFKGGEAAREFRQNIRGQVPIETPVRQAMDAIDNIIAGKNADYKTGMAQAGLNQPIAPSSFGKIAKAITDAGQIDKFDLIPSVLHANEGLTDLVGKFLNEPSKHTVEGLDALKQAIGEYNRTNGLEGTKAGQVANTYYHAVESAIKDQAPGYAKIMENYSEAKDLLGQLQKSFSLPANERKLNIDTALRKLQSVMRNNANTNWGYRASLMKHLEENGAPNLKYALAGQALNTKAPRGLAKISGAMGAEIGTMLVSLFSGHPGIALAALKSAGVTAVGSSPRLMGEAAYYAGRVAKPVSKVFNRPNARILNQAGAIDNVVPAQSRGGAIDRALRATKRT